MGSLDTVRGDILDKFNLVITDMTMPNMTGENLAKKLIKIRPGIPIILCTGFSDKIDELKVKILVSVPLL